MPENNPGPTNPPSLENQHIAAATPKVAKQPESTDYAHVPIGEEFSSAKWKLPPAGIVVIAVVTLAVVLGAIAWFMRAKPGAKGQIDDVAAVAASPGNVLVAVQMTLTNVTDKPFGVWQVDAKLQTSDGKEYQDTAASVADFERYFQAFPDLRQHASGEPLKRAVTIPRGATLRGSAIFGFPVTKEAFDQRKSLSVKVQAVNQPVAVVLTKP